MDNDFLLELATEVRGVAIHDQPLIYVEVVAEYDVEAWCPWNQIMILFYQYSLRSIVCIANYSPLE